MDTFYPDSYRQIDKAEAKAEELAEDFNCDIWNELDKYDRYMQKSVLSKIVDILNDDLKELEER
jgi:hypothetical protein